MIEEKKTEFIQKLSKINLNLNKERLLFKMN